MKKQDMTLPAYNPTCPGWCFDCHLQCEAKVNCAQQEWTGCYSGSFDLISPESFAHPAKMAPNLCYRIIDHLEELGLLKPGATILDPMGGTGLTAICANAKGYKAITVELESKFISFQQQNKEYAARKLGRPLDWTIIQGDSRKLSELLQKRGVVTVTSPPYVDAVASETCGIDWSKAKDGRDKSIEGAYNPDSNFSTSTLNYSTDPNNIGNLKDKPISITSPPYEDTTESKDERFLQNKNNNGSGGVIHKGEYGQSEGQIGQEKQESYLQAMSLIYQQIALVSDVCVVVTKNPTKAGKLRDLCGDTKILLEAAGFRILCHHKAILFKETERQDLFGQTHKKLRGRVSFFKRLSIAKGNIAARWEDVLVAVKDGGGLIW